MKHFLILLLLISCSQIRSQKLMEMTPKGFMPVSFTTPNKTSEKLMELSKSWPSAYTKESYDITNVTENSITVTTLKRAAAYYYNIGVKYDYDIRYELKVIFNADKTFTLTFNPKEFYANDVLTKTTVADFYTPQGKLKDDFSDVKPSLEATADRIVKSYASFISN